jgi:hypothetical protein
MDDEIVPLDNTGFVEPDGTINNVELMEPMLGNNKLAVEDKFDMLMKMKSVGVPFDKAKTMID